MYKFNKEFYFLYSSKADSYFSLKDKKSPILNKT